MWWVNGSLIWSIIIIFIFIIINSALVYNQWEVELPYYINKWLDWLASLLPSSTLHCTVWSRPSVGFILIWIEIFISWPVQCANGKHQKALHFLWIFNLAIKKIVSLSLTTHLHLGSGDMGEVLIAVYDWPLFLRLTSNQQLISEIITCFTLLEYKLILFLNVFTYKR